LIILIIDQNGIRGASGIEMPGGLDLLRSSPVVGEASPLQDCAVARSEIGSGREAQMKQQDFPGYSDFVAGLRARSRSEDDFNLSPRNIRPTHKKLGILCLQVAKLWLLIDYIGSPAGLIYVVGAGEFMLPRR
jgi:hypothetical protein